MCEILVTKHNNKGIQFEEEKIHAALTANSDGAGYVVFEKVKNDKYEIIETKLFKPVVKARWTYQLGDRTNNKDTKKPYTAWDFDLITKTIILSNDSDQSIFVYPKSVEDAFLGSATELEIQEAIEKWLDMTKISYDFSTGTKDKEEEEEDDDSIDNISEKFFLKQARLKKNQLMIMHFRMATSGRTHEFTQPIINETFLTIHNGVFSALGTPLQSDTAKFSENLEKLYNITNIKTPKEEKTLIETLLDMTEGYYSAFFYSFKTKSLFYFKHGASFYSFDNKLLYSTRAERFPLSSEEANKFI